MNEEESSSLDLQGSNPNIICRRYMRPVKASCLANEWNRYENRSGKLRVRHLKNVTLLPMGQVPGIEDNPDRIIDDCDFYAEIADNDARAVHVEGKVLYAGYMRKSWGHFLMNSTARLWPLFQNGLNDIDKIVFFAEDDRQTQPKGNFREFLSLLGVLDKCVVLKPGKYHFDDISIGQIALEMGKYYSSEFMMPFDAVRISALSSQSDPPDVQRTKGIILSRSQWNGNDKIQINIEKIDRVFTLNGYKTISPESISLRELIVSMHNADEVVSYSGSTAHDILFSSEKRFVILERCAANNMYQIGIMKMMKNENILVDCFYQPLLASSTDNLTIYGMTPEFVNFIKSRGWPVPSELNSPLKEIRRYIKIYRRHYGYGLGINNWEDSQAPAIREAYYESYTRYKRYLNRNFPVLWCQYFSPTVIYKTLRAFKARIMD